MNAIEKFLPNTIHILCTWHIEKKILTNASKIIKDPEEVGKIMPHWSKLVKLLSPSDFYSSFKRFSDLYNQQLIKYIERVWIPLSPWFYNSWTEKLPHFDHQTTSRIESSHAYIKTHLLNSQAGFPEAIKLITLALKAQHHKIKSQFHQQKITSLQNINSIFASCHGKISNYALWIAQKNF